MGCDIHAYIENQPYKESSPEYWWKIADLHAQRNYAMFGLLAGVRGGEPLFAPRGWDKNSSTKWEFCMWISDEPDADGTCSKEQARKYVSYGSEIIDEKWVTNPDWHTPSWLTAAELEQVIRAYKEKYSQYESDEWEGYLELMKRIPESRIIFWFDN
jgi:hypothetical protein